MQIENSLVNMGNTQLPMNNTYINKQKSQAEVAAVQFSALFFERVLNSSSPEVSLITGEPRSSGEIYATEMLNSMLAEKVSQSSDIKEKFTELLKEQRHAIR